MPSPSQPHSSPAGLPPATFEIALAALLAVALVPFTLTTSFHGDEFTNLYNAVRMLEGQVIYRDFFELTGPLTHWLLAWVYAITGPSLLTARLVQAAAIVLAGWQLFRLARGLGVGPWTAMLPGLILVAGLYRHWPGYSHHWMALPFVLAALQAGMKALASDGWRWWGIAGVAAGLSCLAMQSDGAVTAIALAATLTLNLLLSGPVSIRAAAKQVLALAGGLALPLALAAAYLAWHGALGAAWYSVWSWPLAHYKVPGGFNDIPFATDFAAAILPVTQLPAWYGRLYHFAMLYALPATTAVAALVWGLGLLWRRMSAGSGWSPQEARLGLVGLCTIGFFALLSRGRADVVRVAVYAFPAVLFATALAQAWADRTRAPQLVLARWLPHAALAAFVATGALLQAKFMQKDPAAWLRLTSPDGGLAASPAVAYIRAHSEPDDRIVAMPNGGFFYFYGRPSATRHAWIWPPSLGFVTAREVDEAWDEIAARRPRFVVVSPDGPEPEKLQAYLRRPLTGYQRVTVPGAPGRPVYLFERRPRPEETQAP
ncbi:MAG: glycosyltransferase family 39 protein [Candidatus Sericytochromatia bacterium]